MASRSRWPGRNAYAVSLSWTRIVVGSPGDIGSRVLVTVAMGQVEHAERHPRRRAVGSDVAQPDRDERRRPVDRELERRPPGAPRISSRSASGALSHVSDRPSSSRWSPGNSGPRPPVPYGHHSPPASPVIRGDAQDAAWRARRRSRPRPHPRRAGRRRADRRCARSAATATRSRRPSAPGRVDRTAGPAASSRIQARSIGSSHDPGVDALQPVVERSGRPRRRKS